MQNERSTATALLGPSAGTGLLLALLLAAGCGASGDPGPDTSGNDGFTGDGSLRVAAIEYHLGDLADPADLARYGRADLLIVQPRQFWHGEGSEERLDRLRAANPDLKIIAYMRSKVVQQNWADLQRARQPYAHDLYAAVQPHLVWTTTGDTLTDWPGAVNFDYTDPAARRAVLDVFDRYQGFNDCRFDGIYWDNFTTNMYISPAVTGMEGEPDMDGDGVAHWDDADEQAAFLAGQEAWARETRERFGAGFIQLANGNRARVDSTFAGLFDGMYYELFPTLGFGSHEGMIRALDPDVPHNLWAAARWPRSRNGGPWYILSNVSNVGGVTDQTGDFRRIVPGDFNRVLSLFTGTTCLHYDLSGRQSAGLPRVELALGAALGPVRISGGIYEREFVHGTVRMQMEGGDYPIPFRFWVRDNAGANIQVFDPPYVYP